MVYSSVCHNYPNHEFDLLFPPSFYHIVNLLLPNNVESVTKETWPHGYKTFFHTQLNLA